MLIVTLARVLFRGGDTEEHTDHGCLAPHSLGRPYIHLDNDAEHYRGI